MPHPVLQRQLRKLGLSVDAAPDAEAWIRFIERVDRYYRDSDQDRYTVERSLEISSEEMRDLTRQLQSALKQVRNLSFTDELTGLRNRRFLNVWIPDEVALVIRKYRKLRNKQHVETDLNLLFLMVDLDHFKTVNDTYGHLAGDQVLSQMGKLLTEWSRSTDYVIRWGGEEFLVVGRQSCSTDLKILTERIRQAVEAHPFEIGEDRPIHVTCSIGASVFPFLSKWPRLISWDCVVGLADICLYAAKHSGRNAWVGVLPSGLISLDEIVLPLDEHLPELIQEAKLELVSSLPLDKVLFQKA
jgi:diguanylate cyclase (GGDEF)-like protein